MIFPNRSSLVSLLLVITKSRIQNGQVQFESLLKSGVFLELLYPRVEFRLQLLASPNIIRVTNLDCTGMQAPIRTLAARSEMMCVPSFAQDALL